VAIIVRRFELSKGQGIDALSRFFSTQSLDRTQILFAQPVQLSPGNAPFILIYDDVNPPYVTGTSPATGSMGIPTGVDIVIQMSEAIDDPSGKITITRNGTAIVEGVDYTINPSPWPAAGSTTITIQGAVDTTSNASYVVSLASTIVDMSGNPMEAGYVFQFTTQDQVASLIIKAGSVVPSAGDIVNGYVDVAFSSDFPDASYIISVTHKGDSAQKGVVLRARTTGYTKSGFKIYFDAEDFSTVETGIDNAIAAGTTAIDAAHTTQINTQHADGTHAAPINALGGLNTNPATGASCVDRAFQAGNSLHWIAVYGAPS